MAFGVVLMGRRGATLIELLITCAVFSLLMVAVFTVMKIGSNGYNDVSARSAVNASLTLFQADMEMELQRACLHDPQSVKFSQSPPFPAATPSLFVYTPSTDYHWAIWFETAMNEGNFPPYTDAIGSGNPSKPSPPLVTLGDPLEVITDSGGWPVAQRWVLYYVTRMQQAEHDGLFGACSSEGTTAGPDTTCPHKWIVKKDISVVDSTGARVDLTQVKNVTPYFNDLPAGEPTEAGLAKEVNNGSYLGGTVSRARIIMQNVVSFELARLKLASPAVLASGVPNPPVSDTNGPIILFDVKVFKLLNAQRAVSFGSVPIVNVTKDINDNVQVMQVPDKTGTNTIQMQTQSTVTPQFAPYTVQVDSRVVPENP
ncbi:MAG: PulJ/GspJ family protein [Candidatus Xenobia bacterium]